MILAGTSSHLWFVPFAMVSALFVGFAQYTTRNLPDRAVAYAGLALGCISLVGIAAIDDTGMAAPIPQWLLSTPSALFGFAMGRLLIAGRGKLSVRAVLPVVACAVGLLILCSAVHWEFLVWRYAVSLCVMVVAFLLPGKPDALSKFFSPLLFGIYLAHHFVADHFVMKLPHMDHSFQGFFVVDFAVTACFVWLLKRTPLGRFVVNATSALRSAAARRAGSQVLGARQEGTRADLRRGEWAAVRALPVAPEVRRVFEWARKLELDFERTPVRRHADHVHAQVVLHDALARLEGPPLVPHQLGHGIHQETVVGRTRSRV